MPTAPTLPDLPLRDIHLPTPIGWWPPAPGWWLLAALTVLLAAALTWLWRRHRRRRWRRAALRGLARLEQSPERGGAAWLAQLSRLLRRAALSHFPRQECAGLNGAAWLAFLDRPLADRPFAEGAGRVLADGPYRPAVETIDADALTAACRRWLRSLPPAPRSGRRS
jgi:hypothetical protein